MDRRRILLIAAAVVATLGTALVFLYVQGADDRAEARFEAVDVLTATAVIEPGESIEDAVTTNKVAITQVPQDQVLANAQDSAEPLAGQLALTRIYPGEQIVADKFGSTVAPQNALVISEKKQGVTLNLTDPARVAGFVNPGSEVAVYFTGTDPKSQQPFTRLLLPRATVIGVGSTTPVSTTTTDDGGTSTTEELPRTLLTLALDQQQAQKAMFAAANGEVAFGLLTDDSTSAPAPGTTFDNLFE